MQKSQYAKYVKISASQIKCTALKCTAHEYKDATWDTAAVFQNALLAKTTLVSFTILS